MYKRFHPSGWSLFFCDLIFIILIKLKATPVILKLIQDLSPKIILGESESSLPFSRQVQNDENEVLFC